MFGSYHIPCTNSENRFHNRNTRQKSPRNVIPIILSDNLKFNHAGCATLQSFISNRFRRLEKHINRRVICALSDDQRILFSHQSGFGVVDRDYDKTMPPATLREDAPEATMISTGKHHECSEPLTGWEEHQTSPQIISQIAADDTTSPVTMKIGIAIMARSNIRSLISILMNRP